MSAFRGHRAVASGVQSGLELAGVHCFSELRPDAFPKSSGGVVVRVGQVLPNVEGHVGAHHAASQALEGGLGVVVEVAGAYA